MSIRYEDFFGGGKKVSIRKPKLVNGSEDDLEDEKDDEKVVQDQVLPCLHVY